MPELPEVEITRRGIAPHVTGRRVLRIDVYDSRLRWPVPADLDARMRGRAIDRVDRRSKYLLLHTGESALLVHLGMTGTLRVFRDPPPGGPTTMSTSYSMTERCCATAIRDASVRCSGSPSRAGVDFVGSDGASGYFQLEYFVYGRDGEPCRACGAPIRQMPRAHARRSTARIASAADRQRALTGATERHLPTACGARGRRPVRTV